jgi:hypothetical protein
MLARVWSENLKGKNSLEGIAVYVMIILNKMSETLCGCELDSAGSA